MTSSSPAPRTLSSTRSRNSSCFGRPKRDDWPAARTMAEIMRRHDGRMAPRVNSFQDAAWVAVAPDLVRAGERPAEIHLQVFQRGRSGGEVVVEARVRRTVGALRAEVAGVEAAAEHGEPAVAHELVTAVRADGRA